MSTLLSGMPSSSPTGILIPNCPGAAAMRMPGSNRPESFTPLFPIARSSLRMPTWAVNSKRERVVIPSKT